MRFRTHIKQNERGRSMVEILGVLAIIGVLSFGGIQGYKYAMDKHRANDIVNEVNMRATDIWHLYQDGEKELPDSPEADAFPEYPEMTQTGFEILVTSHPPVAFRTWVNNVPSAVCQKVLQENLDDAVQGLKFVQVDNGGGLIRYTGDIAICGESGTENQMVFTSFLDEDGGAVASPVNPDNPNTPLIYCVEQDDCPQECGGAVCEEDTMTCRDACAGTDKPICMRETGTCVECQTNDDCAIVGDNYVCNTADYTCQEVRKCVTGEYRAKSGACIPCDDINAVEISQEKFFDLTLNIEDDTTGVEQCNACNNTHTVTVDEATGTTYCGVGCIKGVTYESLNDGCIPCRKADGSLNTEPHRINQNNNARSMCEACGLIWWNNYYLQNTCGYFPTCEKGTFLSVGSNPTCVDCNSNTQYRVSGWEGGGYTPYFGSSSWSSEKINAICTDNCRDENGNPTRELGSGALCKPLCQQPDEDASITACTDKDDSTVCNRQFRSGGVCYACSTSTSKSIATGGTEEIDTYEEQVCVNCGRTVKNGYCIIEKEPQLGQFRGKDGNLYNCTVNGADIVSEEDSGCIANCRQKNGKYSMDADATPIRWIHTYSDGSQKCFKTCPSNKWQSTAGMCMDCSQDNGTYATYYNIRLNADTCEKACQNTDYPRENLNGYCVLQTCPNDTDGMVKYRGTMGDCLRCDYTGQPDRGVSSNSMITSAQCARCNNRVAVRTWDSWAVCALINPGSSGVCNSKNVQLPENMPTELKAKVQPYVNGDYDGQMFRDNSGYCHECTTSAAPSTSAEQCNMCNIDKMQRTYTNGVCSLGGCQTDEFMNNTPNCVKCKPSTEPSSYISSTYQLKAGHTSSCTQCGNRQIMTIGSTGLQYCVPNDCIQNADWQSVANGKCQDCTADNNVREIGTELVYRQLCEACNRVAFSKKNGDNVSWYCSKIVNDGYFVDASGAIQSCSSASDTMIPNTSKAISACEAASCNRVTETDRDGQVWCMKN